MSKVIRIDEPTPNGGAYSELVFLDENNDVVDESNATHCVIRECTEDGTTVAETWGIPRRS